MKIIVTPIQLDTLRATVKPDVSQDVTISKWQFLHVTHRAMSIYWQTTSKEVCKTVEGWREMTAEEINQAFAAAEWQQTG